ncbi:CBS domain-containing protein [Mesorhizobium sp. 8]|uniref:CBS domain-containing protein n=1 Tax=Mesorhizobium sp. 8 TaxID=2584466 RepID=UPI001FEE0463|nr:CBS domain-containing protein [Mesorhizobium sp. 8]
MIVRGNDGASERFGRRIERYRSRYNDRQEFLPRAIERLAVIEAQAPVREAAALMSRPHTDLIVVCDRGAMVGVLTKTDIVGQIGRCMGAGCTARVDAIMTRDVTYCRAHELLLDVWSTMRERGLQRVPVLDEGRRPLGIIYAREALQALLSEAENEEELLRDYVSGIGYR